MNSGGIFTEPRSGEVNILPLFTEIEKNNCFSIYTLSDLNIFRRKPLKIDLIDLSIHAWKKCKWYKACANSRNSLQNIKSSLTSENFHSKFRGLLCLCAVFLRFLIPKHWRNASLHPPFCFCLAFALFTR